MDLRTRKSLPSRTKENGERNLRTRKKRKCEEKKEVMAKKRCRDGRKIDSYCWICHKLGQDKICSLCPKVYHVKCLKGSKIFNEQQLCPECQLVSISGNSGSLLSTCSRLSELMNIAMDIVFCNDNEVEEIFYNWPRDQESNTKLYQVIDAETILEKLNAGSYKKPIELLSDFKWIYHNCCIVYGEKSTWTISAEKLTKKFKEELYSLEACPDCYFFRNSKEIDDTDFFSQACGKPHDIVFAKVKGFSYWPAKCLEVSSSGSARVVFFGTHEMSSIPANMWFSLKHPKKPLSQQQKLYTLGITELLKYTDNISSERTEKTSNCIEKDTKETQTHLDESCDIFDDSPFEAQTGPRISSVSENYELYNSIDINECNTNLTAPLFTFDPTSISVPFCESNLVPTIDLSDNDSDDIEILPSTCKNVCADTTQTVNKGSIMYWPALQSSNPPGGLFKNNTPVNINDPIESDNPANEVDKDATVDDEIIFIKECQKTSSILKQSKPCKVNTDQIPIKKLISAQNPQFVLFLQEKSKQLVDAMLVQLWAMFYKSSSPTVVSDLMKEAMDLKQQMIQERWKMQALKESEKEWEVRFKNTDSLIQKLNQSCQSKVMSMEQEKDISELKAKLATIKKEKAEITEKYNELQNASSSCSTD